MMKPRALGSVLMVLGTSIGAGMLALPIASAGQTFLTTLLMMLISWALMTIGALSLLEVNLWLEPGTNMISMAKEALGQYGKLLSWFFYLVLLYSLMCAYLSGTGDVLYGVMLEAGIRLPRWLSTAVALFTLVSIVYSGISSVDIVNRGLMVLKSFAFIMLVGLIVPFVHVSYLAQGAFYFHGSTMMVMITSFGYAIIVPSLRSYLNSNVVTLKRVLLIGSLLPMLIYLVWVVVVQGVVPRLGHHGLVAISHSKESNTALISALTITAGSPVLSLISKVFVAICVMTSFLGVSLCMFDFMTDGLQVKCQGRGKILVAVVSFLPPLLIVLWRPGIFIEALSYAGVCCVILLIILPIMMLYCVRYRLQEKTHLIVPGGKVVLLVTAAMGVVAVFSRFLL